jgi:hypothetical protein
MAFASKFAHWSVRQFNWRVGKLFGTKTHTHTYEEVVSFPRFATVAWSAPHIFQHSQAQGGRKESSNNGKFLFYQHLGI